MEKFRITLNGQSYEVEVERISNAGCAPATVPAAAVKSAAPASAPVSVPAPAVPAPSISAPAAGTKVLASPMPGKVVTLNFSVGSFVKKGDVVLILEAMKMQNEILAPADGQVADIRVQSGQTVRSGDPLVIFH